MPTKTRARGDARKSAAKAKPFGASVIIQVDASGVTLKDLLAAISSRRVDSGSVPALGQPWPGMGGCNGGLYPGRTGERPYYLIVPNTKEAHLPRLAYGGYEKKITGADSFDDGVANTKALLASGHSHPAARACADFKFEGHADFFLPARNQARYLSIIVPELFEKEWHWTSTRYSSYGAYVQGFGDGAQSYDGLGGEHLVRPIRRHFID
jgi:hypothetical protein